MTNTCQFRDYHSVDFDLCLAIFDSNVPHFFAESERPEFEAFLLDLPGPYLVLEDHNKTPIACGGYAFVFETHSADLCWGMVNHDVQHKGFGALLLNERLERIKENPAITDIQLSTSQHTEAFFSNAGFETTEIRKNGFSKGLHQHLMTMKLK